VGLAEQAEASRVRPTTMAAPRSLDFGMRLIVTSIEDRGLLLPVRALGARWPAALRPMTFPLRRLVSSLARRLAGLPSRRAPGGPGGPHPVRWPRARRGREGR